VAAFGAGAATLGIFRAKAPRPEKSAGAGWYNTRSFELSARQAGLYADSINGDAFADAVKQETAARIRKDLGQVDLLVYSLAAPRRVHPRTGVVHNSVIKPIGTACTAASLDINSETITQTSIEPAEDREIADTVTVMGGEDWQAWIDCLSAAGVLSPGATTVAYSYMGPSFTWPIYRQGTIGAAKAALEATARELDSRLAPEGGRAYVCINKAVVTQASAAIPMIALYMAALFKVMKAKGLHEGCIEQMYRLFTGELYGSHEPVLDEAGRIRLDDQEMRSDVQAAVSTIMQEVNDTNLRQLLDLDGYRADFLRLFGFGLAQVDYSADIDPCHVAAQAQLVRIPPVRSRIA
jgi:enoyl-[acyl-carrier protein] reductase / trans-2-enoyl-CoA reductase (NAD+)